MDHFEVTVSKGTAKADTADDSAAAGGASKVPEGTPADLASETSRDGYQNKDVLLKIAKDEGVALEGDEPAAGESAPLTGMVEKPKVEEAPSTLAVIGRYLLPGEIFPILAETPPGAGNEIQLTDAIETLRKNSGAAAYRMQGQTYDCGSQLGYLEATLALGRKHPTLGEGFRQLIKQYAAED